LAARGGQAARVFDFRSAGGAAAYLSRLARDEPVVARKVLDRASSVSRVDANSLATVLDSDPDLVRAKAVL
jgi:predicted nicotinamide N-methyase